jgi:large subunit ribosomal protein L30
MTKKIQIVLTRSPIRRPETQRRTLEALGLRKIRQSVVHVDSPGLQGQLAKVHHLVDVTSVDDPN